MVTFISGNIFNWEAFTAKTRFFCATSIKNLSSKCIQCIQSVYNLIKPILILQNNELRNIV